MLPAGNLALLAHPNLYGSEFSTLIILGSLLQNPTSPIWASIIFSPSVRGKKYKVNYQVIAGLHSGAIWGSDRVSVAQH
jgi:hypothetical protein